MKGFSAGQDIFWRLQLLNLLQNNQRHIFLRDLVGGFNHHWKILVTSIISPWIGAKIFETTSKNMMSYFQRHIFLLKEMLRPSYIRFSWLANLKQDPEGCSLPRLPTDDNGGFLKFPRVVSEFIVVSVSCFFFLKKLQKTVVSLASQQFFHLFCSKLEFPTVLSQFVSKLGLFSPTNIRWWIHTSGSRKNGIFINPNTVKPPPTQPHLQLQHLRIDSDTTTWQASTKTLRHQLSLFQHHQHHT